MSKPRTPRTKAECGCPCWKRDLSVCKGCSKTLCPKHAVSRVDGNNGAITRNAPTYCEGCYREVYRGDFWTWK